MALSEDKKKEMWVLFSKNELSQRQIAKKLKASLTTVNKQRKEYDAELSGVLGAEFQKNKRVAETVEVVAAEAENFAHDSRIAVELIKDCLAKIKSPETNKTEIEQNGLKIRAAKDAIAALTDRNKHLREITGADKTTGIEEDQRQLIESLDELVRRDQERQTSHLRLAKHNG